MKLSFCCRDNACGIELPLERKTDAFLVIRTKNGHAEISLSKISSRQAVDALFRTAESAREKRVREAFAKLGLDVDNALVAFVPDPGFRPPFGLPIREEDAAALLSELKRAEQKSRYETAKEFADYFSGKAATRNCGGCASQAAEWTGVAALIAAEDIGERKAAGLPVDNQFAQAAKLLGERFGYPEVAAAVTRAFRLSADLDPGGAQGPASGVLFFNSAEDLLALRKQLFEQARALVSPVPPKGGMLLPRAEREAIAGRFADATRGLADVKSIAPPERAHALIDSGFLLASVGRLEKAEASLASAHAIIVQGITSVEDPSDMGKNALLLVVKELAKKGKPELLVEMVQEFGARYRLHLFRKERPKAEDALSLVKTINATPEALKGSSSSASMLAWGKLAHKKSLCLKELDDCAKREKDLRADAGYEARLAAVFA